MGWFKWKGVQMPNYVILESTPSPVRAERVTSIMDMPNNVPIIYRSSAYKTINIPVKLGFRPRVYDRNFFNTYGGCSYQSDAEIDALTTDEILNIQFDSLYNWLQGGGTLTFSSDADKYYNAVCDASIVSERLSKKLRKLPVQFTCMPFRYALEDTAVEIPLESLNEESNIGSISYNGTEPSEPTIKVYCTGTQTIAMDFGNQGDSTYIKLNSVTGSATIDVQTRRVYDANGNVILNTVEGDITKLRLKAPSTRVVIDKTCTKLEIKKNTRWR